MRRGISELVSAVILIVIVLSAMFLYMYLFSQSYSAQMTSFRDAMVNRRRQADEMLSIFYTSYHNSRIYIYVYDYGYSNISIDTLYIGNQESSYSIIDGYTGNTVSMIQPGKPYVIELNKTLNAEVIVTILTASNNIYTVDISP